MLFSEYMTFLHLNYGENMEALYIWHLKKTFFYTWKSNHSLLFCSSISIFLFNLLSVIIQKQPDVRRSWGRGPGSFRSWRYEPKYINVNIMLNTFFHNINSLWKHLINVTKLILSWVVMIESEKSWKKCFDMRIGEL